MVGEDVRIPTKRTALRPNTTNTERCRYGPSTATISAVVRFRTRAIIDTEFTPLDIPSGDTDFNDSVAIPHYGHNDPHNFGRQRRGISARIAPVGGAFAAR